MPAAEIDNIDQLRAMVGHKVGVSDWVEITQSRINQFAEATEDRQWIHVDPERAKRESPYGTSVAHGFLTLSMLSLFIGETIKIHGVRMGVNYGFNRVRFPAPVPAGARIRAHFTLHELQDIPGGIQTTWGVVVECQGLDKPCCVAEWVNRRYE